jgi:2,3-bisphosphoglycerate-dependent phosphoglycerate mutase
MKKELHIYIFRHGQTTYNRDKRFTGFDDPSLTKLGVIQAKYLGKILKEKRFDIAFSSRLRRSKNTLKEVLKYHPECKKILIDDRIIERNYGNLNGTLHSDYIKKYGQNRFDSIHRGFSTPPPRGESFAMVEKRVSSFIKDLKKMMKKERCNVAISAHGNSIRLFRKIMEKASIEETISLTIPYDRYFEYKIKI